MTKEDIMQFKEELSSFSLEELESLKDKMRKEIGRMILDNDLISKVTIVDSLIEQKKGQNEYGKTKYRDNPSRSRSKGFHSCQRGKLWKFK